MRITRLLAALIISALLGALLVQTSGPALATTAKGRGIASRVPNITSTEADKLKAAGAGWTYAWRYRNIPDSTPSLDVVPMIRTGDSFLPATKSQPSTVDYLKQAKTDGRYKYLLGFNEPDNSSQADMTPAQAAALWPKLQQTGLVLGSPAPAHPTNGWLKEFLGLASKKKLKVDFIALHFYANIVDDKALARIKTQIQAVRQHYGKPIWITELGIIDTRAASKQGSTATNWARSVKFMKSVTTMLDSLSYVQRYAWVADQIADTQPHLKWSALYDSSGKLTPLGTAYSKLGD